MQLLTQAIVETDETIMCGERRHPMTSNDFKAGSGDTAATDIVKQIATLASSSVVVLATFLSRLPNSPDKGSLNAAVILLLASLVFCAAYLGRRTWMDVRSEAASPGIDNKKLATRIKLDLWIVALVFLTFGLGIIYLGISVLKMLSRPA